MKTAKIFVYAILTFVIVLSSFSQGSLSLDYPFLRSVRVAVSVTREAANAMFFYSFSLHNDTTSVGSILALELGISRSSNSVSLDTIGLRFKDTLAEGHFRRRYPGLANYVVPVSIFSLPRFWLGGFTNRLTISISKDTLLIEPGQGVEGLELMSRGLPGIRKLKVRPYFNIYEFFPSLEDTTAAMTSHQRDSILEAVNFLGLTIGPTAPPSNFVALAFLDTLLSYTRQSAELGWLGRNRDDDCDDDERPDDGVVRNIENRLQKARRELVRRDSVKARKQLEKLVRKVGRLHRRGERVMTSEAYSLLKYNTEYLIERLPERRRR